MHARKKTFVSLTQPPVLALPDCDVPDIGPLERIAQSFAAKK
jgi:hypothetical protein